MRGWLVGSYKGRSDEKYYAVELSDSEFRRLIQSGAACEEMTELRALALKLGVFKETKTKCECENCKHVRDTAQLLAPNPPFEHADNLTVETWNRTLREYPCLRGEG
jgi:hypothetical protein